MIAWIFLVGAILAEVSATLALRASVTGSWKWYFPVTAGYIIAFALLSGALASGMGLGVAYGIWAAAGVAITAVMSKILFKEPLTLIMSIGIVLVIGGVLLVEIGAH